MNFIRTLTEQKTSKRNYLIGLVLYIVITLILIILKFILGSQMSGWWLLLPAGLVITGILILLVIEYKK
jgi:uncharacterized membrane protein YhaH (DUF805 family)